MQNKNNDNPWVASQLWKIPGNADKYSSDYRNFLVREKEMQFQYFSKCVIMSDEE